VKFNVVDSLIIPNEKTARQAETLRAQRPTLDTPAICLRFPKNQTLRWWPSEFPEGQFSTMDLTRVDTKVGRGVRSPGKSGRNLLPGIQEG